MTKLAYRPVLRLVGTWLAFAIFASLALLSGCLQPVANHEVRGLPSGEGFWYDFGEQRAHFELNRNYRASDYRVVDSKSYAIAPSGRRYGIETEDMSGDINPAPAHLIRYVYLLDTRGRRDEHDWVDGAWRFVITIEGPEGEELRDFEVWLRTVMHPADPL